MFYSQHRLCVVDESYWKDMRLLRVELIPIMDKFHRDKQGEEEKQ